MDNDQQHAIAEGLNAGETDAWNALFDHYSQPIWRYVARMMGNRPHDIADVVQETFLAAARSARSYDATRGSLWMWLWGIAANQVKLHYRQDARHQKVTEAAVDAVRTPQQSTPPQQLETEERVMLIRRTLLELPADYAGLLLAKYVDGRSVQELAGSDKTTIAAMNSKLARARQAFRRKFEAIDAQSTNVNLPSR